MGENEKKLNNRIKIRVISGKFIIEKTINNKEDANSNKIEDQ